MLTIAAAKAGGIVKLSRLALRLTYSSHISSKQLETQFSRRKVRIAEKILEVNFLYRNLGRHAQPYTNYKAPFYSAKVNRTSTPAAPVSLYRRSTAE